MILLRGTDILDCINGEFYQADEVDAVLAAKDRRIAELESRIAEIEMEALVPVDHGCQVVHDLRVDPADVPRNWFGVWVWRKYHGDVIGEEAHRIGFLWQGKYGRIDNVIAWQELPRWEETK